MVDAVEVEKLGRPTVTIVHDAYARAAQLHADALGMPSLPLVIEPAPVRGGVSVDVRELAVAKFETLLRGVLARHAVEEPDEHGASVGGSRV